MIELFSYGSTNGHKVAIALEELGLPYEVRSVNVFAGEGRTGAFLALNPTGKIPVIRDHDADLVLTESDAILLYLADKAGRLVPRSGKERIRALELLFLQASLQGPMFGQRMYFSIFASDPVPYAIRRYEQQGEIIDRLVDDLLTGVTTFSVSTTRSSTSPSTAGTSPRVTRGSRSISIRISKRGSSGSAHVLQLRAESRSRPACPAFRRVSALLRARPLADYAVSESLLDEPTNLLVLSEWQRASVPQPRLLGPSEPTKHVRMSEVKRRVSVQGAAGCELIQQPKTLVRVNREGGRDCPIQLDHGRALVVQQLAVEHCNLWPVGICCRGGLGVHGGDCGLNLVRARASQEKRLLDQSNALVDLSAISISTDPDPRAGPIPLRR